MSGLMVLLVSVPTISQAKHYLIKSQGDGSEIITDSWKREMETEANSPFGQRKDVEEEENGMDNLIDVGTRVESNWIQRKYGDFDASRKSGGLGTRIAVKCSGGGDMTYTHCPACGMGCICAG